MAIKKVQFLLNGQTYDLNLDDGTGAYTATISAPTKSSWNAETDHKYHGVVTVQDTAGNEASATVDDFPGLGLRVIERNKPTISPQYPTSNAYIPTNKPTITWTVQDDDSGINKDSITVQIDSLAPVSTGITAQATESGFSCSYVPVAALDDGAHTIKFSVSDNDGNAADVVTVNVTVDTVPPTLNVTSPVEDLVTNNPVLTVTGETNDATSSPVTVKVKVGQGEPQTAVVGEDGAFSAEVSLVEGENVITVIATDAAGKSTEVTRTVTLDTVPPTVVSVTLEPNPVDAGKTYVITVEVSE